MLETHSSSIIVFDGSLFSYSSLGIFFIVLSDISPPQPQHTGCAILQNASSFPSNCAAGLPLSERWNEPGFVCYDTTMVGDCMCAGSIEKTSTIMRDERDGGEGTATMSTNMGFFGVLSLFSLQTELKFMIIRCARFLSSSLLTFFLLNVFVLAPVDVCPGDGNGFKLLALVLKFSQGNRSSSCAKIHFLHVCTLHFSSLFTPFFSIQVALRRLWERLSDIQLFPSFLFFSPSTFLFLLALRRFSVSTFSFHFQLSHVLAA